MVVAIRGKAACRLRQDGAYYDRDHHPGVGSGHLPDVTRTRSAAPAVLPEGPSSRHRLGGDCTLGAGHHAHSRSGTKPTLLVVGLRHGLFSTFRRRLAAAWSARTWGRVSRDRGSVWMGAL